MTVVRSRARRLLRESFRQHQHKLARPVELVLVARPSIAGRGFAEVEKDFLAVLRRALGLRRVQAPIRAVRLLRSRIAARPRRRRSPPRWTG